MFNKFIKYILIICFSTLVNSQENKQFPNDFFGVYKGKLEISNANGSQSIDMEFHLLPSDTIGKYHYTIIYKSDKINQERKYTLIEKNKTKGQYIVDENNGILLNAFLANNTLYSIFEVQGNLLTTTEHFFNEYMDFEIMFGKKENAEISNENSEDKSEVTSYPISTIQKARLYKQ